MDREQVISALTHIYDPVFKKPLTELQFVRDVMVKENGQAALTVLLSADDEQLKAQYRYDIEEALSAKGVEDVHIRFRALADHEKAEMERKLSGQPEGGGAQRTRPQSEVRQPGASPLLSPESGVRFIAVASGKGGVGKSTVTVNLAAALARKGKKVGVIDADIYGFSVPDMMGIDSRPQMVGDKIIPVERFGIKVMSMGFFVEDNAPIIWRGPMLGKMLRNFFAEVQWGELDYLLLDLPPGTGDVALDVHTMIPQSKEIIVTTPHATAAFVAARAGAMAVHTKHEIIGVVENMSYYVDRSGEKDYVFGRGGGAKLAEELHTELLAQIPLGAPDNHVAEPDYSPSVYKAGTAAGAIYDDVADKVIARLG